MFKYILFDLDGTITDSAPGITDSVKYALNKLNEPIPPYETLKKFIGPPLSYGFMNFCGLSKEKADLAVEYYREYYRVGGMLNCEVYEGVEDMLTELYNSGKKIVLATSKPEEFAIKILEHFELNKYFHTMAGATFDSSRASKSAVIEYALNKSGITDKNNAIMVGDRHHDIEGAAINGIKSVGVLYGFGDRLELESAGADYIAETADELTKLLLNKN